MTNELMTTAAIADTAQALQTVLLVEDDEDARMLLRIGLGKQGLQVLEAGSVDQARVVAEGATIDLLISDWQLPDGDATDLRDAVDPQHKLPAVLLTGFDGSVVKQRARSAGYLHLLVKPVKLQTLLASVDRAWSARLAQGRG